MNDVEKTTLVKLMNKYMWESLTKASALEQNIDDNFKKLYKKISPEEMTISHLSKNRAQHFSTKEIRIIEKLSALYLDILVCKIAIDNGIKENGENADMEWHEEIIKMALKEVVKIKKNNTQGIKIFYVHDNVICIKYCPYFVFSDILLKKMGVK